MHTYKTFQVKNKQYTDHAEYTAFFVEKINVFIYIYILIL